VEQIDAAALGGGWALGLEAGGGVQAWLTEQGRGSHPRSSNSDRSAFDLRNGGNKAWGRFAP
jgi:L-aminopeptidase/D-esterase-like protein